MNRTCNKCGQTKDITDFYKTGRKKDKNPDNRHYTCKDCTKARVKAAHHADPSLQRRRDLRRLYDISLEEYEEMLERQAGKCAICKTEEAGGKHGVFNVDHDHVTGKVRELLCKDCNIVLGLVKDSPEHLNRLIAYVIKHNDNT